MRQFFSAIKTGTNDRMTNSPASQQTSNFGSRSRELYSRPTVSLLSPRCVSRQVTDIQSDYCKSAQSRLLYGVFIYYVQCTRDTKHPDVQTNRPAYLACRESSRLASQARVQHIRASQEVMRHARLPVGGCINLFYQSASMVMAQRHLN